MTGVELATYATQAAFFCVAVYVALHTVTRPTRSNLYILAFFLLLALVIAYTWIQRIVEIAPGTVTDVLPVLLVMSLPYVLLRLAKEFASVPHSIMRLGEAGLLVVWVLSIYPGTENFLALLVLLSYFAGTSVYAAVRFYRGSENANGITERRLRALCLASALLGTGLASVAVTAVVEGVINDAVQLIRQGLLLASALLYLVGFAPPLIVRRSWQEPEIRRFLRQTQRLARGSSLEEILEHIEHVVADTVGAPNAVIGLYNPENGMLEFKLNKLAPGQTIGGRAFEQQRAILSLDTVADDPENREIYERGQAFAVVAAPITTEQERIGVVALYSPNPPIFAEDDLALLSLLADQIAVILENRKHLQLQAELTAREESARMKDEFLSVAAHDLKTPLTTIIGTGQFLERRLRSLGAESTEFRLAERMNRESKRLQTLVQGLLDASRIERGQLITDVETTDLSDLLRDVVARTEDFVSHQVDVQIESDLVGEFDPVRMQQVFENLLENARKYSPPGTTITVRAWNDGTELRFSVADQGVGIAPEEQTKVFDRFYRSVDSENGATPGIGLGLYICKQIVDQHGGRIWVESTLGEGTTFHIALLRTGLASKRHDAVDSRSG